MSVIDTLSNLKTAIIGTKTTNIDLKLDKAVSDISSFKSHSGRNGYIDLVKSVISKSTNSSISLDNSGSGGLFNQGVANPASFGQGGRLLRYKMFDGIVGNISYCFRALNVLADNIMSPDDITKTSLEIKSTSYIEDKSYDDSKITYIKEVVKRLKLEQNLETIVKNTLKYGDYFCEVADAKTALTSRSMLTETAQILSGNKDNEYLDSFSTKISEGKYYKVIMDYSSYMDLPDKVEDMTASDTTQKVKDEINTKGISKYNLIFHEPNRVIKLQSDMFPLCFGYLVFPKSALAPHLSVQDDAINTICLQILNSIEKKIPNIRDITNNGEIQSLIKSMIEQSDPNKALNVRYVAPDRIQHFMINSGKYLPYGESIFDSSQFSAKVFIALETALAIHRLSRSTEKRKISVELGLPRDAKKMIEGLKEEMRKRKISLDSFGTVDTIPSMISTFEDIYIPTKDGKAFVDISTFNEGGVDVRGKVDELKFIRDQVVASLGVPASFINIEENLSNKAALSEENILFARTIVSHQKYFTHQINDLIIKVCNIINPEFALDILDDISIALAPPKSLQFEREAKYMGDLATLIETLERIGIPREYAKKKYLTNIDWEDLQNYEIGEKIEKSVGTEKKEDDSMGGMSSGMSSGGF